MFQLDWYDGFKQKELTVFSDIIPFDKNRIESIQYTFWAEHCLECAPPDCFKSCKYYQKRSDGHCKRTEHGQEPVNISKAILGKGVYLKFRPWAKIETYIYNKHMSLDEYKNEYRKYQKHVGILRALKGLNVRHVFNNMSYYLTTRSKYRTQTQPATTTNFLFELQSFHKASYKMIIEAADVDWKVIARNSVDINPGFNSYLLNYEQIAPDDTNVVRYYPENSIEAGVLIVNCDFIAAKAEETGKVPAKQVKCVAWDLDNTIWKGILSETDNPDSIELKPGIMNLINELDKRGVIQTIVSKNDYESAWKQIVRLGLSEYFLYPAINWGQKSKNLQAIAKELNINIDTFAMIDDSAFEREEIISHFPQVRVYDENIITTILTLPEFNFPVSGEASRRREMYQSEAKRKQIQVLYDGGYLDFIKSCEMVIEIARADKTAREGVYERCYELVSRTNQLNITGHKYSQEDFEKHYYDLNKEHIYFDCKDKYGKYGIVGYVSFEVKQNVITIDELALSCRVAQKHVEYTVFSWIARNYAPNGIIRIKFIKNEKNEPMYHVLMEIGFREDADGMTIECPEIVQDDGVIKCKGTDNEKMPYSCECDIYDHAIQPK